MASFCCPDRLISSRTRQPRSPERCKSKTYSTPSLDAKTRADSESVCGLACVIPRSCSTSLRLANVCSTEAVTSCSEMVAFRKCSDRCRWPSSSQPATPRTSIESRIPDRRRMFHSFDHCDVFLIERQRKQLPKAIEISGRGIYEQPGRTIGAWTIYLCCAHCLNCAYYGDDLAALVMCRLGL